MKLLIVSTAPFLYKQNGIYAYSPYVNELVIWEKYADEISFCCPIWENENGLLTTKLPFEIASHFKLIDFNLNSFSNIIRAFFLGFYNLSILFRAMLWADHIHLRCPGNIGLFGSIIQIVFPNKIKTAKYAGNWDPKSQQPWSYRLQKWIINNPFLSRKMQVLVYGQWEGSKNIKTFFTATYREEDKLPISKKEVKGSVNFVFVGTLVKGKNPLYAIQLVEFLSKKGYDVHLCLYGEGIERTTLEQYVITNQLEAVVKLQGNQSKDTVQKAYQNSHFVVLPSDSEGWPKAIAEGMFWGCVPLATSVSCVPYMLDGGKRGVLLELDLEKDAKQIEMLLKNQADFDIKRENASEWSRSYTLDVFEQEIVGLLKPDLNSKIK
ncbi:glycosyltransferase family 4 protein [Flavobacterium sp. LB1P71]|uniref:glycosyltransferase family 4 protein n=1 Tax=unclassified Flavobacterium TaxID=196869 RepID=UPI003AAEEAB1